MKNTLRLTLFLLLAHLTFAIDLPPAPEGFAWQEAPEIKGAFLKPKGWYFKHEVNKGTHAYFITKEDLEKNGEFLTGLTVNVFHPKNPAVEHAEGFIDERVASTHGKKWTKDFGLFREFGCLCKITDAGGSTMTNTLMVANPKTNTLYLFIFESPDAEWETAWKTGTIIMDTLAIDDEI